MSGNMARTRPHSSEAFPAPVAPAIRTCVPCSRTSQGRPSSRRPTGSALRSGAAGDREGGDEGGQGVAADELQHHRPGPGGADPAQQGAEPVRQVVRVVGEVGRGLPGDQPDVYPVGVPGGGDLAEHGQQDPALIPRGDPGDGHDPGPAAPVAPGPPRAPGRAADPAGERDRPEPPPGRQDHDDGQAARATRVTQPRLTQVSASSGQDAGGQRVPGDQPDQPAQQPGELHRQDDAERGPVDRCPPEGQGERVAGCTAGPPARRSRPCAYAGHLFRAHGREPRGGRRYQLQPPRLHHACHHAACPAGSPGSAAVAESVAASLSSSAAYRFTASASRRPKPRPPRSPRPGRGW